MALVAQDIRNRSPLRVAAPGETPRADEHLLKIRMLLPDGPMDACLAARGTARLADMVEPASRLCDMAMRRFTHRLASQGEHVPCQRGCCACCRFLVPISPPEAMALAENISRMPARRRMDTKARFDNAARAILGAAPATAGQPGAAQLSQWYRGLDLDCPFLENGACAAYAARPLACREHLVVCAPRECADGQSAGAATAPPLSLAQALSQAAAIVEGTEPQSLLLPLGPHWTAGQSGRCARTYQAAELAEALSQAIGTSGITTNTRAA